MVVYHVRNAVKVIGNCSADRSLLIEWPAHYNNWQIDWAAIRKLKLASRLQVLHVHLELISGQTAD